MSSVENLYHELAFYTLSLRDARFIHQHIVDAQTAQTADKNTKPIAVVFSLAGLYLYVEQNYTGKQVQQFHMLMAKNKKEWPAIVLPENRGNINVADVVKATPGEERNTMIYKWCVTVWQAFFQNRETIINIVKKSENKTG